MLEFIYLKKLIIYMQMEQRHHFANIGPYSQSYGFSSSRVRMWELDHKEVWALKKWCFQIVGLEKTLKSPLDCKEIKPVNTKGNHSWIFIGRTDVEAETPILWPPNLKSWLSNISEIHICCCIPVVHSFLLLII